MKICIIVIFLLLSSLHLKSSELYIKTFGNISSKPLIFLHGGPGYNSSNFEAITAMKLSKYDFFVIVYDRRGEGRSTENDAKYNYEQTFNDLLDIYKQYNIEKSILVGHSFGGIIATLFAEKYPQNVESIVYVSTPFDIQKTFTTILNSSKKIYENKKDSVNFNYINILEKMDTNSIQYATYCFFHAQQNGFYFPNKPSTEAQALYEKFKNDSTLIKFAGQMNYKAPLGFWQNESYTRKDIAENVKLLKKKNIKLFGLYGNEDGLFSPEILQEIKNIIGEDSVKCFDNCSHNVFIDKQSLFISAILEFSNFKE